MTQNNFKDNYADMRLASFILYMGLIGHYALGTHQHTFCSHLIRVLSRNLNQSMLKNANF